ncbi:MAG: hypothetical protein AB8H86_32740 [Polyangiales bacterium]
MAEMLKTRTLGFVFALFALAACEPEAEPVGGTCASYGVPCVCSDGRQACAPHSNQNICPCGDESGEDEVLPAPTRAPTNFSACTADEECVTYRFRCYTRAVHRDHLAEFQQVERLIEFQNCEDPEDGVWPAIRGVCRDGACVVVED